MTTVVVWASLLFGGDPGDTPPELWLYCATNLLVDDNVDRLQGLFERAGKAGYTKVLLSDSKLARLGSLDERYFANARRAMELARKSGLALVPAICPIGYSEGLLFHDPNLAEALPVKDAPFVVKDGVATIEAGGNLLGAPEWKDELWKEEPPKDGVAKDAAAKDGGWRCRDPNGANARVVWHLKLAPWREYHLAATIETLDFDGEPRLQVLAADGGDASPGLVFSSLGCKATQPATRHHAVFNSLDHTDVRVYAGAWGATRGELAISEPLLEPCGPVNLVRRDGAPFEVKRVDASKSPPTSPATQTLLEGRDFEPVADPKMGTQPWPGAFDVWHEAPPIRLMRRDGRLPPDGTRLLVSWSHAVTVYDGQVMICPSEPRTLELIRDEAKRVHELFDAHEYFLSHDEIRVLNQDESCRRRKLDAGPLLADHVRQCVKAVRAVDPKAKLWIWSDMFDPSHNAHADYYLVRGDLKGSWEGLDPSVGVANWNFGKRDESLAFFAGRGHSQLIAGYYDGPVDGVKAWLESARRVKGVTAVMYTTWQAKYDDLERFAAIVRGR